MNARLYLDIDGVLNSDHSYKQGKEKYPREYQLIAADMIKYKRFLVKFWGKEAVNNLKILLDEISPDIYIHSTWKHHFSLNKFKQFFKQWNLNDELIKGIVPQYKFSSRRCHNLSWHIQGERIKGKDEKHCHNYVILDDIDLTNTFPEFFSEHQVVVNSGIGLTNEDAQYAINLFIQQSNQKGNK